MSLVRLHIEGISYSQTQSGAYALILSEADGKKKLPIVIGPFEAQSIAIALEADIKPPRPLTHDLFKNFCDKFEIVVKQVIIHKLSDGIFYSSIIAEQEENEQIIDARTSDAIALALRFEAPIFTYKDILEKAGVYLQAPKKETETYEVPEDKLDKTIESLLESSDEATKELNKKNTEELHQLLNKAIAEENYEKAAKIRDEISKRQE